MKEFLNKIFTVNEAKQLNPQSLAFIGDAVHTLFVRSKVLSVGDVKSHTLHTLSRNYVKASGQSDMIEKIIESLNDDELDIFKRARNYKTKSQAKNSSTIDYKRATGFEAVIGFLYITGQKDRLFEILKMSFAENQE